MSDVGERLETATRFAKFLVESCAPIRPDAPITRSRESDVLACALVAAYKFLEASDADQIAVVSLLAASWIEKRAQELAARILGEGVCG